MNYLKRVADEISRELPTELVPEEGADGLMLLYALLCLSLGKSVTSRNVHDAWTAWMSGRGERHSSMVPFEELPADVQLEDEPFAEAIRTVAGRRERTPGGD